VSAKKKPKTNLIPRNGHRIRILLIAPPARVPLSPPSRQCILNSWRIMGALNELRLLLMMLMMLLLHSNESTMMPMLALSPIPPLNLLASMQARQDEDEGNAAARASLPPQRHITTRIMHQWPQHQQTAANPPSRRAQEVHQLHCHIYLYIYR
jgi:hypothetical protein